MIRTTCPGSGKRILKKDTKRAPGYKHGNEGYRAACPSCGKICAVGPVSRCIQKHAALAPAPIAPPKQTKLMVMNVIYETAYQLGREGTTVRPERSVANYRLDTWIMAYMDGLADGGHTKKLGAFKRWLTKYAIPY